MSSSLLLQFLKLFVKGMTLRYFVLLSCSLKSLFRSEFSCQQLIWETLHLLLFYDTVIFNVFHASYFKKFSHTLFFEYFKMFCTVTWFNLWVRQGSYKPVSSCLVL